MVDPGTKATAVFCFLLSFVALMSSSNNSQQTPTEQHDNQPNLPAAATAHRYKGRVDLVTPGKGLSLDIGDNQTEDALVNKPCQTCGQLHHPQNSECSGAGEKGLHQHPAKK
ncbi:hypothetical protein DFQ27_005672 [Actinomortierella ambigua]|uniref:Uncharacterized protein n=1 Tax=Actinomortierella ambigua TaxID=1343610 RepID=A0A9P6U2M2_9FUNG|nr:hypothetical protein DFQ27_005672 [Actinomortierella ambigua]